MSSDFWTGQRQWPCAMGDQADISLPLSDPNTQIARNFDLSDPDSRAALLDTLEEQVNTALNGGAENTPRPASNVDRVIVRADSGELLAEFVREGDAIILVE